MKILDYLNIGHERTVKLKKNVFYSLIIKGLNVLINLLLVPITLDYLDVNAYGVWLTLSSIVMWFSFFDIGLGNGLRNKLAEAIAINDQKSGQILVSTAYGVLTFISSLLILFFIVGNIFIDWNKILNVENIKDINLLTFIVFIVFFVRLTIQLINPILRAHQESALTDLILLISNITSLVIIYILSSSTQGSILLLGCAIILPPILITLVWSYFLFRTRLNNIKPKFKSINLKFGSELISLGLRFFIIQVAALILFSSANIIIAQLFSPREVTTYNIAFKYFSILTMLFNIIATPFWSAYTEAYIQKDITWMRNATKKLIYIWSVFVLITIPLVIFADSFYYFWIGDKIKIPIEVSIIFGLYTVTTNWNLIFVSFLNGTGKIGLQLYHSIFVIFINIPMSIFLAKNCNLGITGIIISICICQLIGAVWSPVQFVKLLNNNSFGIWDK